MAVPSLCPSPSGFSLVSPYSSLLQRPGGLTYESPIQKEGGPPPSQTFNQMRTSAEGSTNQLHAPPGGLRFPLHQLFHVCLQLLQAPLIILAGLPLLGLGRDRLRELLTHLDQAVPKPDHQDLEGGQRAHTHLGVRGQGHGTGAPGREILCSVSVCF